MIVSIGTDIIEVERIHIAMTRTLRFGERVFTRAERDYCESRGASVRAQHYAARFAAKEAAFKALGTGWRDGLTWHDAEVTRDARGAPSIVFHNLAQDIFNRSSATHAHLSLSHTATYAIAYLILEGN